MKSENAVLNFFGKIIVIMTFFLVLSACATTNEKRSLYQVKMTNDSQIINVSRDAKTYGRDQRKGVIDCPIEFYINGDKVRGFSVNEQSSYYLEPGSYTLQVENCHGRCSAYDMDFIVNSKTTGSSFILSIDLSGKPFIIRK